ncbi:MAG: histidine phosphatase family protein [Tissierellia bacterium]|nr:histidine phosphatase family protein [Tissierellia bacterium]
MKIYLVRHGETTWNQEERLQGWLNSPLSKKGKKDAEKLSKSLKNIPFDLAYSSDQGRAIDTAKIILEDRDIPIIKKVQLRELALGPWEGMTFTEVQEKDKDRFGIYFTDPSAHSLPNTEDYHDLLRRIHLFLEELKKRKEEHILIVSHGVTIQGIINTIEGRPLKKFWEEPLVSGASLTLIEKNQKEFEIKEKGSPVKGKMY